ncbi:MAG: beta-propeller domain-containing protein [Eubacteriales bacterium]
MRKFILLIILLALFVIFMPWLQPKVNAAPDHNAVFVVDRSNYLADGRSQSMDAAPFIENDRVFVPARFLSNALGISDEDISWDGAGQSVAIDPKGVKLGLTVGSSSLSVDNEVRAMDVAPLLRGGRVYLPARWVAEAMGYTVGWDEGSRSVLVGSAGNLPEPPAPGAMGLPVVGSFENLKALLEKSQPGEPMYGEGLRLALPAMKSMAAQDVAKNESAPAAEAPAPPGAGAAGADYSKTNVQVEGVDEADIVKTDGSYIYQVNRERIVISRAYPAEDMKVVSTLDFSRKSYSPQEMYVDDKYLVVIGSARGYWDDPIVRPMSKVGEGVAMPGIVPPYYRQETVKAIIYDIGDRSNPKQVRELEIDGGYVSSRKVGPAFYLAANKYISYYPLNDMREQKPAYRDTAVKDGFIEIDYPAIKYFPDFERPNYLVVAGLNLDRPDEKAFVDSYLGSGEDIYASPQNLYVAVTCFRHVPRPLVREGSPQILPEPWPAGQNRTKVYKFAMDGGKLVYSTSGEVPGTILNQFSMDEYNNHFRIATTVGDVWRSGEYTSKNNVYVLDSGLKITGKIEDIAPGEKIYSTRFLGDRGYMVTFKTVDPFFVIDLKDPGDPKILGKLKIPGYSDYLHPYDENHIIGFGKDTVEIGQKGVEGSEPRSMAFYQGMKMAIFDVTDVANPVEMFKETIGDRGTDSELLHNHKALLFSKEKNLLAFPVTVMDVAGDAIKPGTSFPEYGQFKFQGAYVYDIDLSSGFKLKGRITHLSNDDYLKAGDYWYDSEKNVQRVLYIGNVLYTLSGKYIKANGLPALGEIKTLEIE